MSPALPVGHAPAGYDCPFCRVATGRFEPSLWSRPDDVIHRDAQVCAFVSPGQFSTDPAYPGHVLVVPVDHHESLYDLPDALHAHLAAVVRRVALALQRLGAEGTSTRQHNEPAGDQEVWHYHQHVFPRYDGDGLYRQSRHRPDAPTRARQAAALRPALSAVLSELPVGG